MFWGGLFCEQMYCFMQVYKVICRIRRVSIFHLFWVIFSSLSSFVCCAISRDFVSCFSYIFSLSLQGILFLISKNTHLSQWHQQSCWLPVLLFSHLHSVLLGSGSCLPWHFWYFLQLWSCVIFVLFLDRPPFRVAYELETSIFSVSCMSIVTTLYMSLVFIPTPWQGFSKSTFSSESTFYMC